MEQTVVKALAILEALIHAEQPQRLTDLASSLSMTKPNVYRLLGTLSELGYVQQDSDTSLYRPTLKVYELGVMIIGRADLVTTAGPVLRNLCEQAHESVQLAVFDDGYVVYVGKVDSSHPLKAITTIGNRVPATCVSTGKAMLAWLPEPALESALQRVQKFTPTTKLTRRAVERDLIEVRRLGYATNRGEWRPGVCGIAAPVRDRVGSVIAAVSAWGGEANILGPRRDELAALVMTAANQISRHLGYLSTELASRFQASAAALKPPRKTVPTRP